MVHEWFQTIKCTVNKLFLIVISLLVIHLIKWFWNGSLLLCCIGLHYINHVMLYYLVIFLLLMASQAYQHYENALWEFSRAFWITLHILDRPPSKSEQSLIALTVEAQAPMPHQPDNRVLQTKHYLWQHFERHDGTMPSALSVIRPLMQLHEVGDEVHKYHYSVLNRYCNIEAPV